jgi:hypothetical protein
VQNVSATCDRCSSNSLSGFAVVSEARLPFDQEIGPDTFSDDNSSRSSSDNGDDSKSLTELQMRLSSICDILNHMNNLSFKIRNPALRPKLLKATLYREMVKAKLEETKVAEPESMSEEAQSSIMRWMELYEGLKTENDTLESAGMKSGSTYSPKPIEEDSRQRQEIDIDIFDEYAKFDHIHMLALFSSFGALTGPDQTPKNINLFERLTQAVTDRRRQIRYWSRHAGKLAEYAFPLSQRF